MRWLMIGTSATAPASLEQLAGERFDKRITCNGGLGLCPDPDVYVAIDQVAIGLHAKAARAAQAGGSWLVTRAEPSRRALEGLPIPCAVLQIPLPPRVGRCLANCYRWSRYWPWR